MLCDNVWFMLLCVSFNLSACFLAFLGIYHHSKICIFGFIFCSSVICLRAISSKNSLQNSFPKHVDTDNDFSYFNKIAFV